MVGQPLCIGHPAPQLQLNTREGNAVSLLDFLGRSVLVSFLSHAA